MYNDLDLKRGDSDAEGKWGGQARPPAAATVAAGPGNALSTASPVADLQRDLRTLGFLLAPEPNGDFTRETEWAVREFQIYAKMDRVAREDTTSTGLAYADRLSQVLTGAHRYAGPVSGVVDAQTRAMIEHWLIESWRCPVVLDAWTKENPPTRAFENVWQHEEGAGKFVVKARDLTDYYQAQAPADLWVVGESTPYKSGKVMRRGPVSKSEHAWQDAEVLPETLVGAAWSALGAAERSTFKVVRAVAEVECYAFFDVRPARAGEPEAARRGPPGEREAQRLDERDEHRGGARRDGPTFLQRRTAGRLVYHGAHGTPPRGLSPTARRRAGYRGLRRVPVRDQR